jgi:RNA polymerase sigma-70 factor (ECF subfamily)
MQEPVEVLGDDGILHFFDQALPEVYGYLLHRTRDKAVAEDLTSEVMLAALDGEHAHGHQHLTVGWLIGIARHKLVDHWRREERSRRRLVLVATVPDAPDALGDLDPGRAHEAIAQLNPTQRLALVLRHVDGLSVPEVAGLIGRSVHATETLLVRARVAFRSRYEEIGTADA